ncbi:hypothetical protein E2562_001230 [Oryza meyeriana var. granulata]|uniref:Uncharacterized protein n=1 Tax=Oryza meyeriana var. granulata TaxID=110450 RepID=A0A6G1DC15_9ORYZ|nr:hypothetical protein E2562_001230 [Oryza meyeriana var. granulata]
MAVAMCEDEAAAVGEDAVAVAALVGKNKTTVAVMVGDDKEAAAGSDVEAWRRTGGIPNPDLDRVWMPGHMHGGAAVAAGGQPA